MSFGDFPRRYGLIGWSWANERYTGSKLGNPNLISHGMSSASVPITSFLNEPGPFGGNSCGISTWKAEPGLPSTSFGPRLKLRPPRKKKQTGFTGLSENGFAGGGPSRLSVIPDGSVSLTVFSTKGRRLLVSNEKRLLRLPEP